MDLSKSPTTKYFLLNPTKEKVILSLLNSIVLILIFLAIPSLGFQSAFLSKELSKQILSLTGSLFFSFVVYYPLACGLIYIFKIITGKEKIKAQNLVIALLFIIIFNPITFSIVTTSVVKKTQVCGPQIVEVTAPSAKKAGLVVGEVIKTVDGYPVGNKDELTHSLANKKPNDVAIVVTNANTYSVTLFANPKDPQQILLGIGVKQTECGK